MYEELTAKRAKSPISDLSGSSVPSLSPVLTSFYNSLDAFNRGVFVKIYRYLWGVVNNYGVKHCGVVSFWWVLRLVAEPSGLAPSSLAVLSYLYMMSNKGKRVIHSNSIYLSGVLPGALPQTVQRVIWDLKHAGLITRHTRNTDEPYLQRSHSRQPVFIKLTYRGVALIERIEKDMNRLLLDTSFNDLTGVNKKPG